MSDPAQPPRGRVALVVDGYSPVGRLVCDRLAEHGTAVAVAGPSGLRAAAYCRELQSRRLRAAPYLVEPGEPAAVRRLLNEIAADLGPLDVLVDLIPARPPAFALATAVREVMLGTTRAGRAARIVLAGPPRTAPDVSRWVRKPRIEGLCVNAVTAFGTAPAVHVAGAVLLLLTRDADGITGQRIEVGGTAAR
ncbi:SDR family NAD(P)-dependent oxidoreductase [Streptomyces sp. NPDC046931]|uniref:SDR family NAD(P)-dependent oxidoreductase n=1 Tax=Streptomyces sp. NPDC046931 TaxID=3154806 RepID=UPI0033FD57D9